MDTTVVCDAGPDTGAAIAVGPGSVIVGRSPTADLTIADDAAELHHLVLEPTGDGAVRITQLSGRSVARIDGRPLAAPMVLPVGGVVCFGASRLRVDRADRRPGDHHRSTPACGVAELIDTAMVPVRQDDDGTMFRVQVGIDDVGAAVVVDLEQGAIVQLTGPGAAGVARSFVVQLAAQVPADRLAVTLSGATGWLPDGVQLRHLKPPKDAEHHIVFVADPAAGTHDPPALRARLGARPDAAVVVLDDRADGPSPRLPGARLSLGALGRGRWAPGADLTASRHVHAAAVTTDTVVRVADREVQRPARSNGTAWTAPVERLATGRPVETIEIVGAWRRPTDRLTLWLGRDAASGYWVQLGTPVVVIGTDPARRVAVLETCAAALALEHGPAALRLVLGDGIRSPGTVHDVGGPLASARIGHELARPQPNGGRITVVVADDPTGDAATAQLAGDIGDTIARAGAGGRMLILGLAPEHPWATTLLGGHAVTTILAGIDDLAEARRVADSRATRLSPAQVMIRPPGQPYRVVTLPGLDGDAHRRLVAVLAHADALAATPGALAVRSCGPCPDDDSPWARPSSDRSSEAMLVPVSSSG